MKYIKSSVEWGYFDQFDPVLDNFLPPNGEGTNLAQQFTVATNKLIYGWYNNKDVYDNTHNITGGDDNLSSYANWLASRDDTCKQILNKIKDVKLYGQYEDILKVLADYVWTQKDFEELLNTPKTGSVYNATGDYKWEPPEKNTAKAETPAKQEPAGTPDPDDYDMDTSVYDSTQIGGVYI